VIAKRDVLALVIGTSLSKPSTCTLINGERHCCRLSWTKWKPSVRRWTMPLAWLTAWTNTNKRGLNGRVFSRPRQRGLTFLIFCSLRTECSYANFPLLSLDYHGFGVLVWQDICRYWATRRVIGKACKAISFLLCNAYTCIFESVVSLQ